LDIVLFRKDSGGSPELIKESQRRRYNRVEDVDDVIAIDEKHKKTKYEGTQLRNEVNVLQNEIKQKRIAKEKTDDLEKKKSEIEKKIVGIDEEVKAMEEEMRKKMNIIGNVVHASVPVSDNEDFNAIYRTWGDDFITKPWHHHELLHKIDGFDPERGSKVASHRGYFLKGPGVRLNLALIQYGLDFLEQRKYTALQTPYFMRKEPMSKTAQLEQFDEELYKVSGGAQGEDHEKYLIATSEQPISAMHQNEWLQEKELPLRYGGYSACFRKEAGSNGKDNWGIFRVHQFEKIEQFCITEPEKSWEMHEEMLKVAEEFYQSLGIAYRVVVIVSGALNKAASKKYDLEGWFPAFGEFRELVSCSNCTDYQSRALEIRCGSKKRW